MPTLWAAARDGVAACAFTLPLSLGLAVASGLPAQYGLWSAIVGGFVASLAASRPERALPAVALVAMTPQVLGRFGLQGVAVFTAATGLWLLFLDLADLTVAVARIPAEIRAGLSVGITLVATIGLARVCLSGSGEWHGAAVLMAATALLMIVGSRVVGWAKASLGTVVIVTLVAHGLPWPVASFGRIGGVQAGLPALHVPVLAWASVEALAFPALAAALLCAIESEGHEGGLGYPKDRGFGERPLLVVGLANVTSSLFGGGPASVGALRWAPTLLPSGPRTPSAGIIHALALAGAPLVLGTGLGFVPVAVLGGAALAHVLARCRWEDLRGLHRRPRREAVACAASATAFLALDAAFAVLAIVLLSAVAVFRERRGWDQHASPSGAGRAH